MSLMDGFWFWIGKQLAEFAMFVVVVGGFMGLLGLVIWLQDRDNAKWRAARAEGRHAAAPSASPEEKK